MALLDTVKTYLGLSDTLQDPLLNQIITDVSKRITNYVGEDTVPGELEWIVQELSIIRYNNIGSEGLENETEEGKSLTFAKGDVFGRFTPDLDKYLESKQEPAKRGKAKFL